MVWLAGGLTTATTPCGARLARVALGQRQSALRALGGSPGPCASREAAGLPGMDRCGGGEVSGGRSSAVYGQGAVVH